MTEKEIRKLERVFKGVANHWRIKILIIIAESPGISLDAIAERLKANYQTIAEHVSRLKAAGLINKRYKGRFITHQLSPYGEKTMNVLKTLLH